jgi:hypothetical protein
MRYSAKFIGVSEVLNEVLTEISEVHGGILTKVSEVFDRFLSLERAAQIGTVFEILKYFFHDLTVYKKFFLNIKLSNLTLSDPLSDLVRHYDFPVPDAFPDL